MLTYDRRAPEALLDALRPDGWAHSLVEYGRSGQYALDLQLRGHGGARKNWDHWATLYVGLTKVVDLHYLAARGFRLSVDNAWKKYGWDEQWETNRRDGFVADDWRSVEAYLEQVIPAVGQRFLKEGSVQSAVSAFQSRDLTVIDREAVIAFSNRPEKDKVIKALSSPLLDALDPPGAPWWRGCPKNLGGECDALAVDADGRLIAMEIKSNKAYASIPWAPLQVRHYANLFTEWAGSTPDAAEIINGMVQQRAALGLTTHNPTCGERVKLRPLIAIQNGASPEVLDRLGQVHRRLVERGIDDPPLEVYSVNLVGRLDGQKL